MLSKEAYQKLSVDYNVIPFVREIIADDETPIRLVEKLRHYGPSFLLESVEGGEQWGRYSILGFNISKTFQIENERAVIIDNGEKEILPESNPVDALQSYLHRFKPYEADDIPRFFGGAVGYFSFESVRFFERCGEVKENNSSFPDACFFMADQLAIFDNLTHTVKLIYCSHPTDYNSIDAAYNDALTSLDKMQEMLTEQRLPAIEPAKEKTLEMKSNMSKETYEEIVNKAKEYIRDGDIIQVVLAQHFSTQTSADPLNVYRALRHINPSPYLYYLDFADGRVIAGSSPEVMVRVSKDIASVRPIAGTRPRGKTEEEDEALAEELLNDPKEIAEHVMLVDLARNDLGRISEIGSVKVNEYMIIEKYSHVMHIVSDVVGKVRDNLDAIDVFKATFPAGTLSGAPKVRAMEIINELESDSRGPYGGALGYIGYGARIMDLAITIRTVVMDGQTATVTAGAGIVFDSVPEKEYEETRHKSRGMRQAIQLAENNLRLEDN
ncbi:MAG: anthranilate synthase component I [Lentisphaeria bacterium]|nr:anthranilate synthase component I [Lentisphaeria bacterium]NQZ67647.1 anthranilate synthase component I [Lentisphaeria bacterium]